jgi:hypothetical protein
MHKILRLFSLYVIAFIIITSICGLVYATAQQSLRQGANDPQIEYAEDGARSIKAGQSASFGPDKIDLNKTLGVFLAVYDKDYKVIDSNAILDGALPQPPMGVFETAQGKGQYRVTWQPKKEIRLALVIVPVGNDAGQFVVAGRSLREVEKRENWTFQMAAAVWVILILVSFVAIVFLDRKNAAAA